MFLNFFSLVFKNIDFFLILFYLTFELFIFLSQILSLFLFLLNLFNF